jgi:hypothetical protein
MAITIIETKRGVNWLIGNDKSRDKGESRKGNPVRASTQQSSSAGFFKRGVGRICRGE